MITPVDENELLSIEQLCDRLFISATTAYVSYSVPKATRHQHR